MRLEFETKFGALEVQRIPNYELDHRAKKQFLPAWRIRRAANFDPNTRIGFGKTVNASLQAVFFKDGHFTKIGSEISSAILNIVIDFACDLADANVFDEVEKSFIQRELRSHIFTKSYGSAMDYALNRVMDYPQLSMLSPLEQQNLANTYMEEFSKSAAFTLDAPIYLPIQKIVNRLIDLINRLTGQHEVSLLAGNEVTFVVRELEVEKLLKW